MSTYRHMELTMKLLLLHILRLFKRGVMGYKTLLILLLFTMALIAIYARSNDSLLTSVKNTNTGKIRPDPEVLCPKNLPELWADMNSLIDARGLYPNDFNLKLIKSAIRCARIIQVEQLKVQNTFKWLLTLEGGQKILFKPLLLPKGEHEHECNVGCEHPEYEITAFAINRLLGFNNMPITTGRQISWFEEIFSIASKEIKDVMKIINTTDVCFKLRCPTTVRIREFCFSRGMIKGSAMVWLNRTIRIMYPKKTNFQYHDFHIYSRLRNKFKNSLQGQDGFCSLFRSIPPYSEDRMFYHIIDMAVIDYILNNIDQRHTYIIGDDGKTIVNIMIDFGQSFCPYPLLLLGAPIYQCCSIRNSTFKAVYRLRDRLEEEFEKETMDDPVYPVLLPNVFQQLQRQLKELVSFLDFCVAHKGMKNVVID
ncbi:hypothetical protein CHS0354_032427 [Potamilus streckersoni]|uniref:FAM20 C-terminal domain-containing protein n=1 Tax=Potamilus streckersoni TaxID=2493646 RepID=A0AAE0W0L5_9BIVA|nr:hypothetical protein CHS0354_032427 [Potamilus streckersoni]